MSSVLKKPARARMPRVIRPAEFPLLPVPGAARPGTGIEADGAGPAAEISPGMPVEKKGEGHAAADADGCSPEEDIEGARQGTEQLLSEARAQVAEFLREARERARAIEAEARERGFREGLESAREAQRALLSDLEALRAEMRAERERFFEGMEPEVVRLALSVAEKIIRQEVDLHPEIVIGVARAAIAQLKEARWARVSAHPEDVELLRQGLPGTLPAGLAEVEVQPAPHVPRGGCVVDSDRGSADARLDRQIERASAVVRGEEE